MGNARKRGAKHTEWAKKSSERDRIFVLVRCEMSMPQMSVRFCVFTCKCAYRLPNKCGKTMLAWRTSTAFSDSRREISKLNTQKYFFINSIECFEIVRQNIVVDFEIRIKIQPVSICCRAKKVLAVVHSPKKRTHTQQTSNQYETSLIRLNWFVHGCVTIRLWSKLVFSVCVRVCACRSVN